MCIAIYKPAGKKIEKERLRQCFNKNDDGAGFMYCHDGKVVIRKGFFTFKDFWRAYVESACAHRDSPFGIHFRIKTHGNIGKENSHPHRISPSLAMIHNGILRIKSTREDDPRSDSAIFADEIVRSLPHDFHQSYGTLWLMESFTGPGNKLVFLWGDGKHLILNEAAGKWDDECWYSNDSYKSYVTIYKGGKAYESYGTGYEDRGGMGQFSHNGSYSGGRGPRFQTPEERFESRELLKDENGKERPRCEYCGCKLFLNEFPAMSCYFCKEEEAMEALLDNREGNTERQMLMERTPSTSSLANMFDLGEIGDDASDYALLDEDKRQDTALQQLSEEIAAIREEIAQEDAVIASLHDPATDQDGTVPKAN
jgi:hypothetical protein